MYKLGWQKIALGGMALLVLVIFVLVAIKLNNAPAAKEQSGSLTPSSNQVTATTKFVLPTVATDPHIGTPIYGVVTSKALNVRASPSTTASVVGSLSLGQVVTLVKREATWYQTDSGGWVSALYVEVRQTYVEAQAYSAELSR